ncbi:MAG: glycosyltransferase family 4 protein [Candidatus Saccharibacteria bacterium]
MKIGFVLDDGLDRGDGVQQYMLTLGKWLCSQGHEIHYLVGQTHRTDIPYVHSLSRNLFVRFNGNRMSIPLPANNKRIKTLLNSEKYDVLHVQMPYSPFLAAKVIRFAPLDTKIVGTFHILPYGRLQSFAARLLSWYLRDTNKRMSNIWSVSEPARIFAQQISITSSVLPNVINLAKFKIVKAKPGSFRIVFLGRLVKRKGCYELLKAFKLVIAENPEIILHIGGSGPENKRLRNWVSNNGLANKVIFDGYIEEADKALYLAKADIAVFPSLGGESFGIVLLEGIASGAGVVLGGNNPGYSSVLGSIPDCLFDPRESSKFANLLIDLYEDRKKRLDLHYNQQNLVKKFDVAVVGEKLLSYYQQP